METLIFSKKYSVSLYQALIQIFNDSETEKHLKIQAIVVLKNIIRIELNSHNKSNFKSLNQPGKILAKQAEINQEFKEIIVFVKAKIVELINSGKYIGSDKLHIKEIILLIADKCFPQDWDDLNNIFKLVYSFEVNNINQENIISIYDIQELFFSILKQQNKKRTLSTRTRFFKVKDFYINMVTSFYEKYSSLFIQNYSKIENETFLTKFFDLIIILDKTLLLLIDCSFNINELYKDKSFIRLLKNSLSKGEFIMNTLKSTNLSSLVRTLMLKNLYCLIKYLSKIQTIFPILFFDDFNNYMNLLLSILFNISNLNENLIKITLYGLFKVFNTQLYKDNIKQEFDGSSIKENSTPIKNNSAKKNNLKGISLIVSPTKLKNYENEIVSVTSKFNEYFSEEAIHKLLDINLSMIPLFFKSRQNSNESDEIDLFIGETDDEIFTHDVFSHNTMDWQVIQRSLLRSIFETFTLYCLKYLKNKLDIIYKNSQLIETNSLEFEAIVYFSNIIPHLYRESIIVEVNMNIIDIGRLLKFIQSLAVSREMFLKLYIITIAKWSDILILSREFYKFR
jgi:hypothetical protein